MLTSIEPIQAQSLGFTEIQVKTRIYLQIHPF